MTARGYRAGGRGVEAIDPVERRESTAVALVAYPARGRDVAPPDPVPEPRESIAVALSTARLRRRAPWSGSR